MNSDDEHVAIGWPTNHSAKGASIGINGIILDVDAIKFRGFHALMDCLVDPHQSIIQNPIAATIYVE